MHRRRRDPPARDPALALRRAGAARAVRPGVEVAVGHAVHGLGDHGRGHDDGAQQRDPLHPGLRRALARGVTRATGGRLEAAFARVRG